MGHLLHVCCRVTQVRYDSLSLSALTCLTRLSLTGCTSHALALSLLRLRNLQALRLRHAHGAVTAPELVVQLASGLPHLTALDFSFSNYQQHHLAPYIQLPGG